MGRPTELTEIVQKQLVEAIKAGMSRRRMSQLIGVRPQTVADWIRKGRDGIEPYAAFSRQIDEADASNEKICVTAVYRHAQDPTSKFNLQAATWLLEVRHGWKMRVDPAADVDTKPEELTEEQQRDLILEAAKRYGETG